MCRSIKTLRTEPEHGQQDVRAAALQYVRKLSGYRQPAIRNSEVFNRAVDEVAVATQKLLAELK